MPLELVPATPKPEKTKRQKILARAASVLPPQMIRCPRCSSLEFVQTVLGAEMKNGRISGGRKELACLHCMLKGERVIVR
jgi:transcription elongation factor Elf1